jgi:hypothetical protein
MLEVRPGARGDVDLARGAEADICSFECPFCGDRTHSELAATCSNCGAILEPRPLPAAALPVPDPARTVRKGPR